MLSTLARTNSLRTLNIRSLGSKPFLGWEGRLARPAECIALEALRIYTDGLAYEIRPHLEMIGLGALIDYWQDMRSLSCLDFRLYAVNWVRDCRGGWHGGVVEVGYGNIGDGEMYSDRLEIFESSWLNVPKLWVHGL